MIRFRQYIPRRIAHVVKSIWYLELVSETPVYEEEIVPDGHHELIFYLHGRSHHRVRDGAWTQEPGALLASQTLQSHTLRMPAGSKLYGIRFYPHTLYPLLGVPLHLLGHVMLPLDDLFTGDGLAACIDEDVPATFRRLETHLEALLRSAAMDGAGYQYVDHSVRRMLATNGTASIRELIAMSGVTAKHYDELFKKYVGITPKCLCSILKFNTVIHYKNRFPAKTLTECAYEAGYYDQSHLIKSFYQWVGASPGQYFHSQSAISDLFAAL
ncbi:MAG TPA: helix-turn-helix domain-containing protein [Puia sp.]|nr:helix-turn-helix domain-containing protein [Puia sp.]